MPKFLPIPWIQWKRFRIEGFVRFEGDGAPCQGVRVCAFDKDVVYDDFLGECVTDAKGRFEIDFTDADFKDIGEARPDIYLSVFRPGANEPVADTRGEIRHNAERHEFFELSIPTAHS